MSKNENIGVYFTLCHIDRGSKSEIHPDIVFVPDSAAVRDSLLSLGAIREADDAEIALFEKLKVGATEDDSDADDKAAAAEAAAKDAADKAAAAAEAAAKTGATKTSATDKLVG